MPKTKTAKIRTVTVDVVEPILEARLTDDLKIKNSSAYYEKIGRQFAKGFFGVLG